MVGFTKVSNDTPQYSSESVLFHSKWTLGNCKFKPLFQLFFSSLHLQLHNHPFFTPHASLSILRSWSLVYLELGLCEHEKSPKRLRRGVSLPSAANFAVRPAHAAARVRRGEVLTQPVIRANMLEGAQLPLLETLNPLDRLPTRRN